MVHEETTNGQAAELPVHIDKFTGDGGTLYICRECGGDTVIPGVNQHFPDCKHASEIAPTCPHAAPQPAPAAEVEPQFTEGPWAIAETLGGHKTLLVRRRSPSLKVGEAHSHGLPRVVEEGNARLIIGSVNFVQKLAKRLGRNPVLLAEGLSAGDCAAIAKALSGQTGGAA